MKSSDDPNKASIPGRLQVRRFRGDASRADASRGDVIHDVGTPPLPGEGGRSHSHERTWEVPEASFEELLVPVLVRGSRCFEAPPLEAIRERSKRELGWLELGRPSGEASAYPVVIERALFERREAMLRKLEAE